MDKNRKQNIGENSAARAVFFNAKIRKIAISKIKYYIILQLLVLSIVYSEALCYSCFRTICFFLFYTNHFHFCNGTKLSYIESLTGKPPERSQSHE